jgi:DNA recombination protein RmuC
MDHLQRDYRVTLAGPTTLLAMLNSLHMGFRTLALEQQASEVWKVLGAVKTEFERYGAWVDAHPRPGAQGVRDARHGPDANQADAPRAQGRRGAAGRAGPGPAATRGRRGQ